MGALTDIVFPEVPQAAVLSASQDIDVCIVAAAGMLVAVARGQAASQGELFPQTGVILTHTWHPSLSLEHLLKESTCIQSSVIWTHSHG